MTSGRDDSTISDEVALWRRLHPKWILTNQGTGGARVTSAAFQNHPGEIALSICITCDAPADFTPDVYVTDHEGYGVAEILVGKARGAGQGVVRAPQAGEVAHGHMVGDKPKSIQRQLAREALILIEAVSS